MSHQVLVVGGLLGLVAWGFTFGIWGSAARSLVLKLRTLVDMAQRARPELFAAQIEPINPFAGGSLKLPRVTAMLRADLTQFGEVCQRLQREAKRLDRRGHLSILPVLVYAIAAGLWYALAR